MVVVFELSVDVFFGGGGGARLDLVTAADPELGDDVDADAGANVTDDEVGVEAIMGSVGCVPFRTVIGMVSDDVTIIATDAGLEWDKKYYTCISKVILDTCNEAISGGWVGGDCKLIGVLITTIW